jgi:3-carboxy-cis,cis-muconate cycloisomerase
MLAIFGDEALVRAALAFEAALARAQAAEGLIPKHHAAIIAETCDSIQIDVPRLAEETAHAGTLAIPLVRHLRAAVAQNDEQAAGNVHFGATSQDVADTALMLQAQAGTALLERELSRIAKALAQLAELHIATPMLGRTLLQPALPISFGLKAANWLLAIDDAHRRIRAESEAAIMLQFGGATGSLAGMDGKALSVAARMAAELGLANPPMPWHARRNGVAALAGSLALVTGCVGKIARDISLMAQAEVAEAYEPKTEGRGGSSAMAHKRNPTGCQIALSAALRTPALVATILSALPQEHERGLGGWQAEAPVLTALYELTHGALWAIAPVVEGLEVHAARMSANLKAADVGNDIGESATLLRRVLDLHRNTDR